MSATLALCAALLAGACSKQSDHGAQVSAPAPVVSQSALTAELLGELGAAIKKNPNDASRILSEKGLTAVSFAQAVRKVAEDPAASKRYADAYKRAS
jgi:hypothetical protein